VDHESTGPEHPVNSKLMAQINSVAQALKMALGARGEDADSDAVRRVENAIGQPLGARGGGGSNAKALRLLQEGFKNRPPVDYYQGGDTPVLPDELEGMLDAQILAPSPKDSGGEFRASDNRTEQYLAAVADNGLDPDPDASPFEKDWPMSKGAFLSDAFIEYDSARRSVSRNDDGQTRMEQMLHDMQPDALLAATDALDGTLNNQSLVVLFTVNGKKLLFVGDAQWGNWSYWLYGKAVKGADPGISTEAKDILGSIDFYKVGHHGSTNSTPIPVVGALSDECASMCSTATGAYGNPEKKTEVPRTTLLEELAKQTGGRLVRSDWVPANDVEADADAVALTPKLPAGFDSPDNNLFIDFSL
jgi:hypothetical protein